MEAVAGLTVGLILGGLIVWLAMKMRAGGNLSHLESAVELAQSRLSDAEQENLRLHSEAEGWQNQAIDGRTQIAGLREKIATLTRIEGEAWKWQAAANENSNKVAELQAQLDVANRRIAEQTDIEKTLLDRFKVMASEVVANNNEAFLATADQKVGALIKQAKSDFDFSEDAVRDLVKPLSDELKRIEEARNTSQGSLKQQIESLATSSRSLEQETRNLSTALKRPEVRGSWGEVQLRRVVELAGMSEHCDFEEQFSVTSEDGTRDRPDVIVRMPSERTIVIDAKTPLHAYLAAVESETDSERIENIAKHAKQVRERARELGKKSYSSLFDRSPDFVVMFLPGEFFLQPALEKEPELMDWAMGQGVVIATPSTLMALLKTIEMGWREAKLAEEAAEIGKLGSELHDRLYTFADNMSKVRNSLNQTVRHFNRSIGSWESRVLPSARKFKELGVQSTKDITEMKTIDVALREPTSVQRPLASMESDDN